MYLRAVEARLESGSSQSRDEDPPSPQLETVEPLRASRGPVVGDSRESAGDFSFAAPAVDPTARP